MDNNNIEIFGAKAHNLQNISLKIPRNSLVTITGLSGCGKSSLAFDTIYAEGQRRYLETFSAYIRNYIGGMERPQVDKITGLSPVIAIEQKSTNKNPRSTVGTVTEIYDLLRLLFARIADAYSINTGEKMVKYSESQILEMINAQYAGQTITILAPIVKGRKGHYRELFSQIAKKGFSKVRVDGKIETIIFGMKLDRYKIHDIETVIDTIVIKEENAGRLKRSVTTAFQNGKNNIMIADAKGNVKYFSKNLMCPTTGISYPDPEPNTFSFNSPYGACPKCNGLGEITEVDIKKLIPDDNKSISQGGIVAMSTDKTSWTYKTVAEILKKYKVSVTTPLKNVPQEAINEILYGQSAAVGDVASGDEEVNPLMNDFELSAYYPDRFRGLVNIIKEQIGEDAPASIQKWASGFFSQKECPECKGKRLKAESLCFKIDEKDIAELSRLDIRDLALWCEELPNKLDAKQNAIAKEIIRELKTKISFLVDVGLGYLSLQQRTASLSGGEAQRIRLATQIGSQLVNVLYILDEPSIGLHQKDNIRLINSLKKLRDKGNSVIVVEHDKDMMLNSDFIVDMGPGAGVNGGKIVAMGSPEEMLKQKSVTCQYLSGAKSIEIPKKRRKTSGKFLTLYGASGNNLKNVDLKIPLGVLTVVTGVSGSGKSSLINDTLHPILSKLFYRSEKKILPYKKIEGTENIDKVIEIDQSPIGRTPRSNPATYIGVFDEIRNLYSQLPTAKIRGYKPGRFSFNVKGGRCETCLGAGVQTLQMNFLPDVYVTCDDCHGKRYNRETLEVRYKGKSINDVLNMSFQEAEEFFENYPRIVQKLHIVNQVGLGYITLGQPSTTLSGGEAQRIKLATELSRKDTGNTLYILDEPTTGLHFEDIRILLSVLQQLVDKGNTMVVIEHNLDVIKVADWLVDMGEKSGSEGGKIAFTGTPEQAVKDKNNSVGMFLKDELKK
ncbi:MAG: excinuclease ABC subunit UvrA [Bacteroidales bacterium]|nr:excinuclease ABC subunit UvrA [Bacteroidales bacterium]